MPKLDVQLREAVFNAQMKNPTDSKARAAGYNHTYLNTSGIDLLALAQYPSQETMELAAEQAADEVDSLISMLGIIPLTLHNLTEDYHLPSISTWMDDLDDNMSDLNSDFSDDDDNEAEMLEAVVNATDDASAGTHTETLAHAAIALSVNDHIQM